MAAFQCGLTRCPAIAFTLFMPLMIRAKCNLIAADDPSTGFQVQLVLAFLYNNPIRYGGGLLPCFLRLLRCQWGGGASDQEQQVADTSVL
jgi:hypothetical protein